MQFLYSRYMQQTFPDLEGVRPDLDVTATVTAPNGRAVTQRNESCLTFSWDTETPAVCAATTRTLVVADALHEHTTGVFVSPDAVCQPMNCAGGNHVG